MTGRAIVSVFAGAVVVTAACSAADQAPDDADFRVSYTETGEWKARSRVEIELKPGGTAAQVLSAANLAPRSAGPGAPPDTIRGAVFERVVPLVSSDTVRAVVRVFGPTGDTLAALPATLLVAPHAHHWLDVSVGHADLYALALCAGHRTSAALVTAAGGPADTVYVRTGSLSNDAIC